MRLGSIKGSRKIWISGEPCSFDRQGSSPWHLIRWLAADRRKYRDIVQPPGNEQARYLESRSISRRNGSYVKWGGFGYPLESRKLREILNQYPTHTCRLPRRQGPLPHSTYELLPSVWSLNQPVSEVAVRWPYRWYREERLYITLLYSSLLMNIMVYHRCHEQTIVSYQIVYF